MGILKKALPYFLILFLLIGLFLYNINADRLIFIGHTFWLAGQMLIPILPMLMGFIVGRGMRIPHPYPVAWVVLDGGLSFCMFCLCNGMLMTTIFGPFSKIAQLCGSIHDGGLRVPFAILSGILLGRLTQWIRPKRNRIQSVNEKKEHEPFE